MMIKNDFNDDCLSEINYESEDLIVSKEFLLFLKWIFINNNKKNIKEFICNEWKNGLKEFYFKEKQLDENIINELINEFFLKYISVINETIINLVKNNNIKSDNDSSDICYKDFKLNKKNKKQIKIDFLKNWNPTENNINN